MKSFFVELKPCLSENTLDKLYGNHDGQFLCLLHSGTYIAGELSWEQGHAPNYYIESGNDKYYWHSIKMIGTIPDQEI